MNQIYPWILIGAILQIRFIYMIKPNDDPVPINIGYNHRGVSLRFNPTYKNKPPITNICTK